MVQTRTVLACLALAGMWLCPATPAEGQHSLSLTLIADENTVRPGGGGGTFTFDVPGVTVLGADVAFVGEEAGVLGSTGAYLSSGGVNSVLADETSTLFGGPLNRMRSPTLSTMGVLFHGRRPLGVVSQ